MPDPFERRVQAAAVAGWWALLISFVFLTLQWFVFRSIVNTPDHWIPLAVGAVRRRRGHARCFVAGRRLEAVPVGADLAGSVADPLGPATAQARRPILGRHASG